MRRDLFAIIVIFALRMLALFMILPVFAPYAAALRDATPTQVGIALGVYGLTQALFQIPFGMASDYFGRKPVILGGFFVFIIGSIIAGLATTIGGVILGRSLQGASAIGSVLMALAMDVTSDAMRKRAMGLIGLSIGVSFSASFVLGPALQSHVGVSGIFGIGALLAGFSMLILVWGVSEPVSHCLAVEHVSAWTKLKTVIGYAKLRRLTFGVLVLHSTITALFLKIPGFLHFLDVRYRKEAWFYVSVLSGALFCAALILRQMEKKKSDKYGIALSVLLLASSEGGILYFSDNLWGLGTSLWLFFTAFTVLEASLPALVSVSVPPNMKGTALGLYSLIQFLGFFIGGSVGGKLESQYNGMAVLIFCIGLAIMWFIVVLKEMLEEG